MKMDLGSGSGSNIFQMNDDDIKLITELLKQAQYSPLTNAEQVIIIYAGTNGYLDTVEVKDVGSFEKGLITHLRSNCSDLLSDITENDRKVSGDLEDKIKSAIDSFASGFSS